MANDDLLFLLHQPDSNINITRLDLSNMRVRAVKSFASYKWSNYNATPIINTRPSNQIPPRVEKRCLRTMDKRRTVHNIKRHHESDTYRSCGFWSCHETQRTRVERTYHGSSLSTVLYTWWPETSEFAERSSAPFDRVPTCPVLTCREANGVIGVAMFRVWWIRCRQGKRRYLNLGELHWPLLRFSVITLGAPLIYFH